jgi:hypothetical protein
MLKADEIQSTLAEYDMRTQSPDTSPEAEGVQIELLRNMTIAQRMSRVRSLTRTTIQLSRRAIHRAYPDMDAGLSSDECQPAAP